MRDPLRCPYASDVRIGEHLMCVYEGRQTWVDCQTPHFGESPMCSYEEPDNSDEACEARLAWLRAQDEEGD